MRWWGYCFLFCPEFGDIVKLLAQLIGFRIVLLIRADLRNLRVFWLQGREERHYIMEVNGAHVAQKWRPMPCPLRIGG